MDENEKEIIGMNTVNEEVKMRDTFCLILFFYVSLKGALEDYHKCRGTEKRTNRI